MASSSLYVYAIVAEPIPLEAANGPNGERGVTGERLVVISASAGTCHAIAGELTSPQVELTADTLRAQDALLHRLAARADALLPARFGSRFDDEAAVRRTLDELTPRLEQALARVRGCEQMTVRLFHAPAPASESVAAPAPAPLAGDDDDAGPGTRYMRRRAAQARHTKAGVDVLRAHLAPYVKDERIESGRLPVIGSIHHLIPRGTAARYRDTLDEHGEPAAELLSRGIRLRVSGPFPAYAFAEAHLP